MVGFAVELAGRTRQCWSAQCDQASAFLADDLACVVRDGGAKEFRAERGDHASVIDRCIAGVKSPLQSEVFAANLNPRSIWIKSCFAFCGNENKGQGSPLKRQQQSLLPRSYSNRPRLESQFVTTRYVIRPDPCH